MGILIIAIALLIAERIRPQITAPARAWVLDATSASWSWLYAPWSWISSKEGGISAFFTRAERVQYLQQQAARLKVIETERDALKRQNAQLKMLLKAIDPHRPWAHVAPISGGSGASAIRSAIIAGGQRQGLQKGQPVRSTNGLVGHIIETGANAARVLLLSDSASRVPVRIARTGQTALAVGNDSPFLELRHLSPGRQALQVGDRIVTSGDGGIYPPDIPVGEIVEFIQNIPRIRPFSALNGLGFVIIEQPWLAPSDARSSPPEAKIGHPQKNGTGNDTGDNDARNAAPGDGA